MNNWIKMGIAGVALAGGLQVSAQESDTPPDDIKVNSEFAPSEFNEGFSIEASDLIAKKLRDYVREEDESILA